jgi:hypothetical protein
VELGKRNILIVVGVVLAIWFALGIVSIVLWSSDGRGIEGPIVTEPANP